MAYDFPYRGVVISITNCYIRFTLLTLLVLRLLLEDRGRITESIRILLPRQGMKQKCFQFTTKRVRRSQQFQLRR